MEFESEMPVRTVRPSTANKAEEPSTNSSGAGSFTIPEKVIHFLSGHMPNAYCDDCLAAALQLGRNQVNTVTSTLGLCREYSRGAQTCNNCGKIGKSATRRDTA